MPARHNGVFQVNIHGDTKDTHIISVNSQFLEKNPNVYQREISIVTEGADEAFPLIAITNLDFAKTLHIRKEEIVGLARPEAEEGADEAFPLIAITNLDFAKTLHIRKEEIVGLARPEAEEVVYIATRNELNVEPYMDTSPRNWIPPQKRVPLELKDDSKKVSCVGLNETKYSK